MAAIAAGLLGSRLLALLGPRAMVALGFLVTAAAAVLCLTGVGQHDRPGLLVGGFVLLGFGLETTLFGCYESMLSEAPPGRSGGAAAVGETAYQLGAGIGIALLGSVMNAAYGPGGCGTRRDASASPTAPAPTRRTRWGRRTRSPDTSAALREPHCGPPRGPRSSPDCM